uniref:SUEL-type lectin domain-containing protein n=1 Tax=Poecilia formosa TaxID=48698 RepID=A0A087XF78_POEFO
MFPIFIQMKFVLFTLFLCGSILETNLVTCEGSVSHIHCEKGVIFMISATYGRSDRMTCSDGIPDDQTKNTDCAMNVESVYDSCHGKSECSTLVSSSVFGDPCIGTYKYLDVFYRCQKFQHISANNITHNLQCFNSNSKYMCQTHSGLHLASVPASNSSHPATQSISVVLQSLFSDQNFSKRSIRRCNGKSECSVLASSSVFGDPCVGTYKYLEVLYFCLKEKSLVACEGAVARLHCARGQVIYVTSASYGRTNKKTCSAGRPADQLENTECYTYREEVGERCNGKQWCKVRASNYVFGNPCYGTYKYLEVEYICYGEFRLSLH